MASETAINSKHASTSTSRYHIREAHFSDLPAIARVWHKAFLDDEIIGDLMHPHREQYPEDVYWFLLRGIRERFWDWRHQFIVVTTRDGNEGTAGSETVVGAADWRRLGEGGRQRELWRADPRNLVKPLVHTYNNLSLQLFPNRAADPARSSFLDAAVADSEKYWTGNRAECWDLHVCGVHPDFQGKGVGKLLARWGVEKAEEEGEGTCASVLCGEKNRGFYGKAGLVVQVGEGKQGGLALFTK